MLDLTRTGEPRYQCSDFILQLTILFEVVPGNVRVSFKYQFYNSIYGALLIGAINYSL